MWMWLQHLCRIVVYYTGCFGPGVAYSHRFGSRITEFLVFMRDYCEEALHIESREAMVTADPKALNIVRKIATLGVVCMEQHGAPIRKPMKTETRRDEDGYKFKIPVKLVEEFDEMMDMREEEDWGSDRYLS